MKLLLTAAFYFFALSCLSQEVGSRQDCSAPAPPPTRRVIQVAPAPSVSLQCGSNTINQTMEKGMSESVSSGPMASKATSDPRSESSPITVALIAGLVGLIGAFAGVMGSLAVANKTSKTQMEIETRKLRAAVVTQERLRWLQDIRQRLAKLYTAMDMQYNKVMRPKSGDPKEHQERQRELDSLSDEVMEQHHVLHSMLNPKKQDQADLRQALQEAQLALSKAFNQQDASQMATNRERYEEIKVRAFGAVTNIGTTTWSRIKELS